MTRVEGYCVYFMDGIVDTPTWQKAYLQSSAIVWNRLEGSPARTLMSLAEALQLTAFFRRANPVIAAVLVDIEAGTIRETPLVEVP